MDKALDINNLYGCAMLQKLPANNFEWIKDNFQFHEHFIKNYNQESDEGSFLKVDAQYPEKLHELHNDLPFLPEKMTIEKIEKLIANLYIYMNTDLRKKKQKMNLKKIFDE